MARSFDARLDELEKKIAKASSPQKLDDLQLYKLATEFDCVEYVTPFNALKTPLIDSYRKSWPASVWLKFLKSFKNKGKPGVSEWWQSLSADIQNYLIIGGSETKKKLK